MSNPNTPPPFQNQPQGQPQGQPPYAPYAPPQGTSPYQASPYQQPYPGQYPQQGDATGGLIPYKNPMALASYYVGVASLIPCIGLLLAVLSVIFAVLGLRAAKQNPIISGRAHAWVGIALSLFSAFYHVAVIVFLVITAADR